jgi:hypothetical protein
MDPPTTYLPPAPTPWRASQVLEPTIREVLEKAVNEYPVEWLRRPQNGEVFKDSDECHRRLIAYSLTKGFDVVCTSSSKGGKTTLPQATFCCIFHGKETRNTRKLEEEVSTNEQGQITSRRKRQATAIRKCDCQWACRVSYKSIGKRGSEPKGWILSIHSLDHSGHDLVDNPLAFPSQKHRLDTFKAARQRAITHRTSVIPYSVHRRIFETEEYGLSLTAKEYYNSVRHSSLDGKEQSIQGLLVALDNAGFIHMTRTIDREDDSSKVIDRQMEQIWFSHKELLLAAGRFVSGSVCIIDATFNTNKERMPLIVAVGVRSDGKTFPVAFSWCRSESLEVYTFFWECLKTHLPIGCIPPSVVISDQAPAILSSIVECLPTTRHQICAWHAVEAMITAFRRHGHTDLQVKGGRNIDGSTVKSLRDLAYLYIRSDSKEALQANRQALKSHLLKPEYIDDIWQLKEDRIIWFYTRQLHNLGHTTSQRSESFHRVVQQALNGQLSLELAANRLCQHINTLIKDLIAAEDHSRRRLPRIAEGAIFYSLRFKISYLALEKVANEYSVLAQLMNQHPPDLGSCKCQIYLGFGLPCRHQMKRSWATGEPLPRSLIHPRWWLNGPLITFTEWTPIYDTDEPTPPTRPHLIPPFSASNQEQIATIRDALDSESLHRFDRQRERLESRLEEDLIRLGRRSLQLQQVPIGQPAAVPKRSWKRVKSTDRAMTANELLAQQARQQVRRQQQEDRYEQALQEILKEEGDTIEVTRQKTPDRIPDSPLVPTTPPPAMTPLPIRTPATPRPRPRREPSPEPSPTQFEPPPSTAPGALGRGKRRRRHTTKLEEAREQGYLPESQEQQQG